MSSNPAVAGKPPRLLRTFLGGLGILAVLIGLFGALGYYWLPGFAKGKLEGLLSEQLHRPVTIQSIDIEPYALTATVRGFRVGEKAEKVGGGEAGQAVLAFDELFVDLSISSLTQRAAVIRELRLKSPSLRLVREAEGRYNVSDLLDEWLNKPDDGGKTLYAVSNILVEGGRIEFIDRPKGGRQDVTELKLGIPFLANLASAETVWVEPHFSARVNGAPFKLDGKMLPFADRRQASLKIDLKDVDLTRLDEYAPLPPKIRLASLRLDSDLTLSFAQAAGAAPELNVVGSLTLHDLDIQDARGTHSLVKAPQVDVTLGMLDLAKRLLRIDRLQGQGVEQDIYRFADGSFEIVGLLSAAATAPAAGDKPKEAAAPPWLIIIREVAWEGARLRYHDDAAQTPFTATIGRADAQIRDLEFGGETPIRLDWQFADIEVRRKADKKPWLTAASASITDVSVAFEKREFLVGAIEVKSPKLALAREPGGGLDLARLAPESAAAMAPTPEPEVKPMTLRIGAVRLADSSVDFIDRTLGQPLPLKVEALDIKLQGVDLAGTTPLKIDVKGVVNKRGRLQVGGTAKLSPLAVQMNVNATDIDLVPLQGWASGWLQALVTGGALSFKGDVKAAGKPLNVSVRGDGRLTGVNVLDVADSTDLMRWRSLDVGGIDVATQPLHVEVGSVALADFFARLILSPEGRLNLADILRQPPAAPAGEPVAAAAASAAPPAAGQPSPVRVGRITLQGGEVNFNDRFIKPNYRANLTELGGRIGPFVPGTPGEVEIRGSVDRTAPLEIVGKLDPFGSELALELAGSARGIDLPKLSPYSGKYIGYGIEKGKLSVDVKYRVDKGQLTAENKIFLDQLTFGDKVDSPDAPSLPVNLAVALLKNSRGEIDIELPISGSLNDPEFSLGGIIFKLIVNLIVKVVTSPFTLLGSLFGGGEELSVIEFAPGRAALTPAATKSLESLAKALADRPGLKLEITGRADPDNDREGLKRAVLERKVKAAKLAEGVKAGEAGGSLRDIELSAEEYPKYLALAYKDEKFPKPKNLVGLTKSLPVPEMEQLMLTNIAAGEDEMRQLADRRARVARDWLHHTGGIAGERLFVLAPKVEAEAEGKKVSSRVEFSLK